MKMLMKLKNKKANISNTCISQEMKQDQKPRAIAA
ncbi:MAG: hypothetical protein ACI8R9_001204 [Paraglaciecola sp.]|jgi:hypothetical protein